MRRDGFDVFKLGYFAQRCNANLKVMNETRVELGKADEFCHITHEFRRRPCLEKGVFRLGRSIAILAYIDSNELEMLGENEALAKVQ